MDKRTRKEANARKRARRAKRDPSGRPVSQVSTSRHPKIHPFWKRLFTGVVAGAVLSMCLGLGNQDYARERLAFGLAVGVIGGLIWGLWEPVEKLVCRIREKGAGNGRG